MKPGKERERKLYEANAIAREKVWNKEKKHRASSLVTLIYCKMCRTRRKMVAVSGTLLVRTGIEADVFFLSRLHCAVERLVFFFLLLFRESNNSFKAQMQNVETVVLLI